MREFERLSSRLVALPLDNINTDQIIPARFLKRTSVEDWGTCLFADWKQNPQFVLNSSNCSGAAILLAGANFGCGSSREHAAWALRDFGFRAVIAPSFADIFRENAIKNGLLPAEIPMNSYREMTAIAGTAADATCTIDLPNQSITFGTMTLSFEIDSFSKRCLVEGLDELGYILDYDYAITAHEVFSSV
jgi:3-isopropylmalate/(R)-2-methylmalate dehydratase small subunit